MNKDDLRDIDIVSFLSDYGYHPIKESADKAWYLSPIRGGETSPSFIVLKAKNKWLDFGLDGKTHSIFDLVMQIEECEFIDACDILRKKSGIKKYEPIDVPNEPCIIVKDVFDTYTDRRLISYLNERMIPQNVYNKYTKEVHYYFRNSPDKIYTAVGFRNDKGGWELRSAIRKDATSPKHFTTFWGGYDRLNLFEGFADYLSTLAYFNTRTLIGTTIVLNGLGLRYRLLEHLHKFREIHIFLDKDNPADKALADIRSRNQMIFDHRYIYGEHKDFNEFWVNLNK